MEWAQLHGKNTTFTAFSSFKGRPFFTVESKNPLKC